MRLSEALRLAGIPTIHRKRGRVSLEDLQVEALRAKTQPSCRFQLGGLQEECTLASYAAALGSPRIKPPHQSSLTHPIRGVASPAPVDQVLSSSSSSRRSSSGTTGIKADASTVAAAADTLTPQQSYYSFTEFSRCAPSQHAALSLPPQMLSSAHAEQQQQQEEGQEKEQEEQQASQQSHHHTRTHHRDYQQQQPFTVPHQQQQHRQQRQHGPAAAANTLQHHLSHRAQLLGSDPLQVLQQPGPGWRELLDTPAGQMGFHSDASNGSEDDSEDYEQSEGTSDFEDAYSDYGTTEEEEENNSIPPADLEAILAESARQQQLAAAGGQQGV